MTKQNKIIEKINIPGVKVHELLELQEYFEDIKLHLTTILIPICIIAQLKVRLSKVKPDDFRKMDTIRTYTKLFLSKHPSLIYVSAVSSLKQTAMIYTDPETAEDELIEDFNDLINNTNGPASCKSSKATAFKDAKSLRKYRRGLMLTVTGKVQSIPVYSPYNILKSIENLNWTDFPKHIPYNINESILDEIIAQMNFILGATSEEPYIFQEFKHNPLSPMEEKLFIERRLIEIPKVDKIKEIKDHKDLPLISKIAHRQYNNIKNET